MTTRRGLGIKIGLSVLAAFAVSLALTWLVHDRLSEHDTCALINHTFESVEDEIVDVVNERLVLQCMAVRERMDDNYPTDRTALQALAQELRVTEIHIADKKGDIVFSSVPGYLDQDGRPTFNFAKAGGQAGEMMRLINGPDTEYCQPFCANAASGALRKYVGVWRPQGGFVEIGCDAAALRELSRSALVDLFRNWRVGGTGGVVVTTPGGLVLSDYAEPNRAGMHWENPDNSFYWERREIDSFPVYVMIPRNAAAVQRDVLVGSTAFLNACALIFVAILVGIVIAGFVRQQIREQAAKELKMATDIQTATLPNVFPPFPEEARLDIWASMTTAKEVGGDFYDFYFIGSGRLFFLVADVSGKGIPAALFMMRAKTLIKGAAQTGQSIDQIFAETNDALCEGNASNTFVTAWAGELNLETGVITYVNAGHNPPLVRRAGKVDYLTGKPSLVLGAMPGFAYTAHTLKLEPGDMLYLYTDGITEQPNTAQELYGEARLMDVVGAHHGTQDTLLKEVMASVTTFASGCEQADDCTQLVLRYRGGTVKAVEHTYQPTMEDLSKATADLEVAIEAVPMKQRMTLMVAADEIFANIVRHSGATNWSLKIEHAQHPDSVRLTFSDDGKPFDPLTKRDPDTTLSAADRPIGGLGILIVKKTMSPVTYTRKNGRNVLMMGLTYGD